MLLLLLYLFVFLLFCFLIKRFVFIESWKDFQTLKKKTTKTFKQRVIFAKTFFDWHHQQIKNKKYRLSVKDKRLYHSKSVIMFRNKDLTDFARPNNVSNVYTEFSSRMFWVHHSTVTIYLKTG